MNPEWGWSTGMLSYRVPDWYPDRELDKHRDLEPCGVTFLVGEGTLLLYPHTSPSEFWGRNERLMERVVDPKAIFGWHLIKGYYESKKLKHKSPSPL